MAEPRDVDGADAREAELAEAGQAAGTETRPTPRGKGLREALLVGELVVVVVLLAGVITYLLPADGRDVVLRTPLLIVLLIAGTGVVLWRISRPGRIDR